MTSSTWVVRNTAGTARLPREERCRRDVKSAKHMRPGWRAMRRVPETPPRDSMPTSDAAKRAPANQR